MVNKNPPKKGKYRKSKDPLEGLTVLKTEKKPHGNTGNQYAKGNQGNRYKSYRDSFPGLAKKLMEAGCTQFEVAQHLNVNESTLYEWASEYPEFRQALKSGGEAADNRVELSLLQKATGYKWVEEVKSKTINDVGEEVEEVTEITKTLPPDNTAMIFWLKNRRSHRWKDKHEVTMTQNIHVITSNELNQLIQQSVVDGEFTVVDPLKELPAKCD